MQAIIPAAGYATRLYPLTENKPKHLLEVKGKPLMEWVIKKLVELQVTKIVVVSNDKYYSAFREWLDGYSHTIPIELYNDNTTSNDDRLGQIGDIQFGVEQGKIDDDLIVVAGDNLFNFSLKPCYDFFKEKNAPVNALWDCKHIPTAQQLGVGIINDQNRMIEFQEKSPEPKATTVSLGIYLIPHTDIPLFKKYLVDGNNPDKMGFFMIWLMNNYSLYGYTYTEKWFDIGWHEALEQARKEFDG
jgi:glucose-1-phosphate thymidylyltransferase